MRVRRKASGGEGSVYTRGHPRKFRIVNLDERLVEVHRDPDPEAGLYDWPSPRLRVAASAMRRLLSPSTCHSRKSA